MQDNQIIFQLLEQNKLLLDEIRNLKTVVANIEAKTDNIHRIFDKSQPEKPAKKLSPRQQRAKDLKDEIDKERALIAIQLSRM